MREIVPLRVDPKNMNLLDTLMAGVEISDVTTFFKTCYSANLSDLIEDGRSKGAVIFVPSIPAKELLDDFKAKKKDDFYADDDPDDDDCDVETVTNEDEELVKLPRTHFREIKRKAHR